MSEVKVSINVENMNIGNIYNLIANDFDRTRTSIWKGVREFLDALPSGSLVADIGCGNGKNMMYRKDLEFRGYDICFEFVKICKLKGLTAQLGDITSLQILNNIFDYTLSIAVIHHLKTREERIKSIGELIRITKSGGKILIYVWAAEQPSELKGKNLKKIQEPGDTYIPFHLSDGTVQQRFYHIYFQGELEAEIKCVKKYNFIIERSGYELGNYYTVIRKL